MVRKGERGKGQRSDEMRRRIIDAALQTLKRGGFDGASARTIGREGGFNPALIFYHFGTVNQLLLAALDETSRSRMERYQELLLDATSLPQVMEAASQLYREDLESGHITVIAQMLAGASAFPELGPEIVERMEPWISFTEEVVRKVTEATPMEQLVAAESVAFGIVSLYLGMELLTHLQGDRGRAESLFGMAANVASLLEGMFRAST